MSVQINSCRGASMTAKEKKLQIEQAFVCLIFNRNGCFLAVVLLYLLVTLSLPLSQRDWRVDIGVGRNCATLTG